MASPSPSPYLIRFSKTDTYPLRNLLSDLRLAREMMNWGGDAPARARLREEKIIKRIIERGERDKALALGADLRIDR